MSYDEPTMEQRLSRRGKSALSISMDCQQNRHTVCIHENCDCCHDGQEYVHGHWRTPKAAEAT